MAGVVFALFAYIVMLDRLQMGGILGGFIAAGIVGLIAGVVCGLFVYVFLRNRDPDLCLPIASWIIIGLIILSASLPLNTGTAVIVILFGAPACLVLTAMLLALATPRRYFGADICHDCGYDLRASVEMGRCPECGWRFHDDAGSEQATPGGILNMIRRMARCVYRHPLFVLLVFILFSGLNMTYDRIQSALLRRDLRTAVRKQHDAGQPLQLARVASFDWDEAHVIDGYSTIDSVEQQLGFRWNGVGRTGIATRDDIEVIAFVKDRRVVRYAVLRIRGEDGVYFDAASPFTREARFQILASEYDQSTRFELVRANAISTNGAPE